MIDGKLTAVSYKPTGFYWRRALRERSHPEQLRNVGFAMCLEIEFLRQWIREQGMSPPKMNVMTSEAKDNGWDLVAPEATAAVTSLSPAG